VQVEAAIGAKILAREVLPIFLGDQALELLVREQVELIRTDASTYAQAWSVHGCFLRGAALSNESMQPTTRGGGAYAADPRRATGQVARPLRARTRFTPTTMQMMAGQNVRKDSKPRPMGFGFGSGHSLTAAAATTSKSGPVPTMSKPMPALTRRD